MCKIEEELDYEIKWRVDEISMIKTIPFLYRMNECHKDLFMKYAIPAIYALWEGFVVSSFEIYIRKLNEINFSNQKTHINIITYELENRFKFCELRKDINKKIELAQNLMDFFLSEFTLSNSKINTESNVNFKVINNILKTFNLKVFEKDLFESKLNKLLNYRNKIAHGETSVRVNSDIVVELSQTVISCMDNLRDIIIEEIKTKNYITS
uniref:MAE_28990/MAE_18760 family HEPN-like nuclease n=1 Tax=Clostridium haemolyticum TaxID=84025 RepID=UPI001E2AC533|nr:MAE_28990/MAE_18760 family HEPN-like nuclease [Clostridium haemolyticum]